MFKNLNIVLGITGGIAAYKACSIVSYLKSQGANVDVIMTKNACEFITPLTLETLSGNKVVTDMFERPDYIDVRHISLARKADLFLIVPATANIIGKECLSLTLRTLATKLPVQAPVPGRGIATKANNPQKLKLFIPLLFFSAFASSFSTIFLILRKLVRFIKSKIFLIKSRIKGMGSIFPITQMGKAIPQGTPNREAAIRPPLSSNMGKSEIIKTTISGESQDLKKSTML